MVAKKRHTLDRQKKKNRAKRAATNARLKAKKEAASAAAKPAAKKRAAKKAKAASAKPKKMSAIYAAAKVLADSKQPMNAKEMIEAMSAKGLWTSPGGATPHATLYSAIAREIQLKGKEARFRKTERGKFAAN